MAPLEGPEKTESQEDRDWDDSDDGISDAATTILVVDKRRRQQQQQSTKRQRRGRPARKKRKKDDHDDDEEKEEEEEDRPPILGYTTTSGSGSSHSSNVVPTLTPTPLSLQPLIDFLASEHAPVEAEDVSFETIAGSTLTQYARIRDALKDERHGGEGGGRGRGNGNDLLQLEGGQYSSLSPFDEASLIGTLETRSQGQCGLSVSEAIILRKLKLQRHRRTQGLSQPLLRPSSPAALTALPPAPQKTASTPDHEVLRALYDIKTTPYKSSFLSRLTGFAAPHSGEEHVVVAVDWEARSPWMDLMEDIRAHYALKFPPKDALLTGRDVVLETVAPITFVTLTSEHLPQVHDILHRSFWSGIDVGDSLQHGPEQATIVAMYKRLVVGCAILSSPTETYITYLAVRAGWENAQIATAMLFHLINRNPNKDITLHVSVNNPAMLLYNRFGFKAEEFIVGFYEDYLDPQSRVSKNAFRLRLRR